MPVLNPSNLEATVLFQSMATLCGNGGALSALPGNVIAICREAADRLRLFPAIHQEFTLHDEVHSLRVVILMGHVLGPVLAKLNAVEIALLILSAYFHDQGMIADADELTQLRESEDWTLHEAQWASEHRNRGELLHRLSDPLLDDAERSRISDSLGELNAAMFTDFIRRTHGQKSASFVVSNYKNDPRMRVEGRDLSDLLALLCRSHVQSAESITATEGYRFDELVGNVRVNVALVAFVLRLSDILDFDRERTPDSLYRAIDFRSEVSVQEWQKHRSVTGWEISSNRIVFSAECEHPAYERAVKKFIAWIDEELVAAHTWNRSLPAEFAEHELQLPEKVDSSRVGPRSDAVTGRPEYHYFDLEFSLARDELVKLLMTDNLYTSRGLFVRELLQNALDALRHRRALNLVSRIEVPDLHVELEHFQDAAGFDVVRCVDNGVGMDARIVTKFLTQAGRSYYRSPEFDQERARFRNAQCDFDPCARFGIGFMSCFMFGDDIRIETRRDNGVGAAQGEPLIVQVTGLSGIVTVRPGDPSQPVGTTVEVRGRRKSFVVDQWSDPVNLSEIIEGYALATEFPIVAECRVPAIRRSTSIPTSISVRPHPLESLPIAQKHVFKVDVSVADRNLRGEIRLCTLVDSAGNVVTRNKEAKVVRRGSPKKQTSLCAVTKQGAEVQLRFDLHVRQVCCDGILVAGEPGRDEKPSHLGSHSCNYGFGNASFLIDVRGGLKPNLTPARTPAARSFSVGERSWTRLFKTAGRAYSALLSDIVRRCRPDSAPSAFWACVEAYGLEMNLLPLDVAWNYLQVPLRTKEKTVWRPMSSVGPSTLLFQEDQQDTNNRSSVWTLALCDTSEIVVPKGASKFRRDGRGKDTRWIMESLIRATSRIRIDSATQLSLERVAPADATTLDDFRPGDSFSRLWLQEMSSCHDQIIQVTGKHGFANRAHAVVRRVVEIVDGDSDARTPLDSLLTCIVWKWPSVPSNTAVHEGSWDSRTRAELGQLWRAIDWNNVRPELKPPYEALIAGTGYDEITEEHLKSW